MTNKKTSKRALLGSAISIVLCFAMLLGTTFAWFTDTVTNGVNQITSGNLDVELWHSSYKDSADNSKFSLGFGYSEAAGEEVEADTKLFLNHDKNPVLWEPGATAVENFRVKNVGSLAFKFMFEVKVANATKTPEGKDLSDILLLYIDELGVDSNGTPVGTETIVSGKTLGDGFVFEGEVLPGEYYDFWVGLEWEPTDYDNEFNIEGGLELDLGINLLATQLTYEKDGYDGDQYDKDADYPTPVLPPITSYDDLQAALEEGGTFTLGADVAFEEALTIKEGVTATIDLAGYDITANNAGGETAFDVDGEVTFINTGSEASINVDGMSSNALIPAINVGSTGTVNFEDGIINITGDKLSSGIHVWEGEVNFNGGQINVMGTNHTYGIIVLNTATLNMNGGKIYVGNSNASYAYGIFGMHGEAVNVNLNAGEIEVVGDSSEHYAVAVMDGSMNLTIADGFKFTVGAGANEYGKVDSTGNLTVNGVVQ